MGCSLSPSASLAERTEAIPAGLDVDVLFINPVQKILYRLGIQKVLKAKS